MKDSLLGPSESRAQPVVAAAPPGAMAGSSTQVMMEPLSQFQRGRSPTQRGAPCGSGSHARPVPVTDSARSGKSEIPGDSSDPNGNPNGNRKDKKSKKDKKEKRRHPGGGGGGGGDSGGGGSSRSSSTSSSSSEHASPPQPPRTGTGNPNLRESKRIKPFTIPGGLPTIGRLRIWKTELMSRVSAASCRSDNLVVSWLKEVEDPAHDFETLRGDPIAYPWPNLNTKLRDALVTLIGQKGEMANIMQRRTDENSVGTTASRMDGKFTGSF